MVIAGFPKFFRKYRRDDIMLAESLPSANACKNGRTSPAGVQLASNIPDGRAGLERMEL